MHSAPPGQLRARNSAGAGFRPVQENTKAVGTEHTSLVSAREDAHSNGSTAQPLRPHTAPRATPVCGRALPGFAKGDSPCSVDDVAALGLGATRAMDVAPMQLRIDGVAAVQAPTRW